MKKRWEEIAKRICHKLDVVGAEIGVERGETAARLLTLPCIKDYYCIDDWRYDPVYEKIAKHKDTGPGYHKLTFSIFLQRVFPYPGKVRIITGKSADAVKMFDDNFFDFVFIDATHSYECVKQDIIDWGPKVKSGGFLCGHDYGVPRFAGVEQAVDEMIGDRVELGDDFTWFDMGKHD